MQVRLSRYRWLLLIACLAAVAIAGGWSTLSERRAREKYDLIRFGMTRAEVSRTMGSDLVRFNYISPSQIGLWEQVAVESDERCSPNQGTDVWLDGAFAICVGYHDDKAVMKILEIE